jgi:hypothetical protein
LGRRSKQKKMGELGWNELGCDGLNCGRVTGGLEEVLDVECGADMSVIVLEVSGDVCKKMANK